MGEIESTEFLGDFSVNMLEIPYKIWVIDDIFRPEVVDKINDSWSMIDESNWHRGYSEINGKKNPLESGMKAISKTELMPEYLKLIVEYFHSEKFTEFISEVTGIKDLIPDRSMRWSGLRTMEEGSYQLIHSDARKHPQNYLTKELTCLFYLNDGYVKENHEGCLEIWDDQMSKRMHEIEPINNRMVVFVNSETSYHGVPTVLKERKAITFSVMSGNLSSERNKALFVARPEDPDSIRIVGEERSKIKDK